MDEKLLEILVCPKSKKKLILADSVIIQKVNKMVNENKCKNINGDNISQDVIEGLYEPENKTFYIIKDNIPVLIYENAINLN
ncbi:MAG: hypothetical protein OEZ13_05655 [Spirochaetia bacterium]|nr:hypothetical protein [Spirochaetia bacterium]